MKRLIVLGLLSAAMPAWPASETYYNYLRGMVEERREVMTRASAGGLRFLYLAPERIGASGVLDALGRLKVSRFIIDEAHCISSWGHDFRPDYRRLGDAVAACGRPPVGAFTATATPRVRLDIIASLGLREPVGKVTGFVRENLMMSVNRCRGKAEKRDSLLARIRYSSKFAIAVRIFDSPDSCFTV